MNILLYNLASICYVSFILTLWFESDIIQTISKLTNTKSLFKTNEFESYKLNEQVMSNYPTFLYDKYPGYTTKLLSCPICLCFWLTLIFTTILTHGHIKTLLILLPINYLSSLLLYLNIRKLL